MEQKEWMTDMMTNNTDILYTSVQLNALCTVLYLISKVSTTVPKLIMRKLNSKKLGNLHTLYNGRIKIQTQVFMTPKHTIPHGSIHSINTFQIIFFSP